MFSFLKQSNNCGKLIGSVLKQKKYLTEQLLRSNNSQTANIRYQSIAAGLSVNHEDIKDLNAVFPEAFNAVVDHKVIKDHKTLHDFIRKTYDQYARFNFENITGPTLVSIYKIIDPNFNQETLEKLRVLGWCVELVNNIENLLYACTDPNSNELKDSPKYVNDTLVLTTSFYRILKKYFSEDDTVRLQSVFNPAFLTSTLLITIQETVKGIENYSMKNYEHILTLKNNLFLNIKIQLALTLKGIEINKETETLLKCIQYLKSLEQDISRIDNDIVDNKINWFICKAMELSNSDQKEILKSNYGRNDPQSIKKVKNVYDELKLKEKYVVVMKEKNEEFKKLTNSNSSVVVKDLFNHLHMKFFS